MSVRMKRITISIPSQMQTKLREVVRKDGRSQGEILRSLIWIMIKDFGLIQDKSDISLR